MEKFLRVRLMRIVIWIAVLTAFAFCVWILDILWFKNNPIIWIGNYSAVVLAIWEIQTTIASLTLASVAFILAKIDASHYGISIKSLLHLSKRFPRIELSFWEKILCSIVLPAITWIFVILDNITAATFLFLFTVYLATSILLECINVITKSEKYSDWAKKVVNLLVDTITTHDKKNVEKHKNASRKQFREVIDGIEAELSAEIRREVNLYESDTYWYFVRLMDSYSDEGMVQFNEQMHSAQIQLLRLAISVKSEPNIRTILRTSYPKSIDSRWSAAGIDAFMYSYYRGDISSSCFQSEIDQIKNDILQASNDYSAKALFVLRNSINFADVDTFVKIMQAVWRSKPYKNPEIKSNVLLTAITYLYYVALKEQYMPIEKGNDYLERLRAFSEATIMESYSSSEPTKIKDILSNTELMFGGANFLLSFFNDRAFNWEYISLGEAKTARLGNDTIEFLTFYCYLFFRNISQNDMESLSLDVLLKMKEYMNSDGIIAERYFEKYSLFCSWLGKSEAPKQVNDWFYISLIEAIKKKMLDEAYTIRNEREMWTNKISNVRKEIIDRLMQSSLYVDSVPTDGACIDIRFCDFHLLKDFSEHYAFYGTDQVVQDILEMKLFYKLMRHSILNVCGVKNTFGDFENSIMAFEEMMRQMSEKGVNVDKFYNFAVFNRFAHRRIQPHISEKIQTFNSILKNAGDWHTGFYSVAVYVDSSKETVGFSLPCEGFMMVTEELTESELRYICKKYKTADGFWFKESSNSVEIPFLEEELIEYLRVAMIKVRYCIPAIIPRHKIGFITCYTE